MDNHRLDGNAAAGVLREIFALEVKTALVSCSACGATGHVAAQAAYVTEIGTVVRCASCDSPLIRAASGGRHWLDLRGVRYLQLGER